MSWKCRTEARIQGVEAAGSERAESGADGRTGGNTGNMAAPPQSKIQLRDVQNHVSAYLGAYTGSVGMDLLVKPAHQRFTQLLRGIHL